MCLRPFSLCQSRTGQQAGVTELFARIAARTVTELDVDTAYVHLDTSLMLFENGESWASGVAVRMGTERTVIATPTWVA